MCEYDVTFPYDSNLTITLHDSNLIGFKKDIQSCRDKARVLNKMID